MTTFVHDHDDAVLAHAVLEEHLAPKGIAVVLEAEPLCKSVQGVRSRRARTVTSAVRGLSRDDGVSCQEFFSLTGISR